MIGDDDDPPNPPDESEGDAQGAGAQPADNAADPQTTVRKRTRQKKREEAAAEFWQSVFDSPVGRREMYGILSAGHCFEERFACGPNGFPQPEATWFNAGQQAFTQRLFQSWSIHAREGVFHMLDEHHPPFVNAVRIRKRGA